ncbi:hypothetical protein LOK49_LG05G02217 [Camellia lanceoleosa]|uniref:Uncharacterized protein n=1 Tax=Camellia lanceoleosa TaxID=1840588 RepID=A0ACC0HQ62_9ERIC|nr:hypothetical protein LOK49_LG05G02217 [Camellia lanceoleosa]
MVMMMMASSSSAAAAATKLVVVVGVLLLVLSNAVLGDEEFLMPLDRCVRSHFDPIPPPSDDPERDKYAAALHCQICHSIYRSVFHFALPDSWPPEYVTALEKVPYLKNNQSSLNYYLNLDHPVSYCKFPNWNWIWYDFSKYRF